MTPHAELLPRYKGLRQSGIELNTRLVETLSRSVINEGGRKLGLLEDDVLLLDTDDELAVLMDYCLHDVRRYGVTAVEAYLEMSPPPPDSDDAILLPALRASYFSLFAVEAVEAGVGVHVRDLLRDERSFLVDVGFSQSVRAHMVLAAQRHDRGGHLHDHRGGPAARRDVGGRADPTDEGAADDVRGRGPPQPGTRGGERLYRDRSWDLLGARGGRANLVRRAEQPKAPTAPPNEARGMTRLNGKPLVRKLVKARIAENGG